MNYKINNIKDEGTYFEFEFQTELFCGTFQMHYNKDWKTKEKTLVYCFFKQMNRTGNKPTICEAKNMVNIMSFIDLYKNELFLEIEKKLEPSELFQVLGQNLRP